MAEKLTLERIFASPALEGPQPRSLEVAPDGSRVTFLKGREDEQDRLDLWELNLLDGQTRMLVNSAVLLPDAGQLSDTEKARRERQRIAQFSGIVDYQWTEDASAILFPLGGDIYLFTLASGETRRLTRTTAFETDPKLSPNGRYVSFVRDQDVVVLELAGGEERALTNDGEGAISNGMAEFVAQEEMGRQTGYWWSPDGHYIAYLRVDNSPVEVVKRYEVLGAEIKVHEQRYPAAGTPNAIVTLHAVDEVGGWVYFTATRAGPEQRQLYRVPLAGGEVRQLTGRPGTHNVKMSKNGLTYIDSFSSRTQPVQVSVHRADGQRVAWLSENQVEGDHPYAPYMAEHGDTRHGTLEASDSLALHWQLTQPKNFDPQKRYPVIVYVYGGPTGQMVTDEWSRRILVEQYWVQQGYLVFTLDNRGVEHYGKAFQAPDYKRLGVTDVQDQLLAVDWLKRRAFVDANRIGVFGWSYGGYMALMLLMQSPGTLAAGAAVAPVTDWAQYDTHYTERYMGTPQADPEAYRRGDVLTYATQLADPLLLVHGMADDNVLFTNSTRLMEALQHASIPFELMTYPGGKHSLVGETIQLHVYRTITDFFNRQLKP